MALNMPEDAAAVLEGFVHDVANTPAEVTHLLEEIRDKDLKIQAYKDEIKGRDTALQKWVRINGGHVPNPKEEAFSKTISNCFDKCEILQAEKNGLSEKMLIVLERQIKRLDVGLRHLSAREEFPSDWNGPSLLSGSATGVSTPVGGGPLQSISSNIGSLGGAPNIANAAQLRMAHTAATNRAGAAVTPSAAPRSQRESSSEANKRRRLNASLGALPAASGLRQSSLGPGTPKAGTPTATTTTSRQGSAQPSQKAAKKAPAAATTSGRRLAPPAVSRKRSARPSGRKRDRRSQLARAAGTGRDGSPSTNASLSDDDSHSSIPPGTDGAADAESDGDEEDESKLYCFCQKVSFGDMVGCDNDDCKYQWFHWPCVGVKSEPTGAWFCPECRKNMG